MKQFLPVILLWLFQLIGATAQSGQIGTCTSTCHGSLGDNIYPNGDFGSGFPNVVQINPGLAPGYIYQTNPPPNDGYYSITNHTAPWGWFAPDVWIKIEDNGPEPDGYMMVVNASYPPGLFFQQPVAVCENTLYEFSVDVINIFKKQFPQSIKPDLSFMIDQVAYCETGDIPNDEQWHTVRFSFTTAPGQTSLLLGMRNNAPGGYGNDLAIDNISFRACGPALLAPDTLWFCAGSSVALEAQMLNSPFPSTAYQWQILANGSWEDIPGADSSVWNVPDPLNGSEYRLLVASATANLAVPNCRVVSQVIRLTELPALLVSAYGSDVLCYGMGNTSVEAQVFSGQAPYNYAWNNGSTDQMLTGVAAGDYQVTITDARGCSAASSVTVNEAPPQLISGMVLVPVTCFGGANGQAIATATGGTYPYVYSWENGASIDTLQGLSAGNYLLTVTDAQGCTVTASASITTPAAVSLSSTATAVSCFGGSDAVISALADGGTGPYDFAWNQGQTTAQIVGLTAGNYTVTVTDLQGCTVSASANVATPTGLSTSANGGATSCFGAHDAIATASVTGGTVPYTFLWSTGQTTAQISGLSAGSYFVTVTDAHGCSASTSGSIGEPLAIVPAANWGAASCFGGNDATATASASGGTSPYTFLWSTGQTGAQAGGLSAGPYTVTLTDAHGCSATATGNIQAPDLLVANTLAGTVSCFGDDNATASVQSTGGTGPYYFLWSNGQTTTQIAGLSAGTYTVTTTDTHGCTVVQWASVDQSALLVSTAIPVETACFGGNDGAVSIQSSGGQAPYQYQWSNGQTVTSMSGLQAGPYSVTTTDALGCTASASAIVITPTAILSGITAQDPDCFGGANGMAIIQPNGGTPPYNIQWQNGQTGASAQQLSAGSYQVTVTDAHGCTHTNSTSLGQPTAISGSVQALEADCFGAATGQAWGSPSGGTPPYTFTWQNGHTTAQITGLPSGWYGLSITDTHQCTGALQVWVGQPMPLSVDPNSQPVSCPQVANGILYTTASGGVAPYLFTWSTGQSGPSISALVMGDYTVTATDARGCTAVAVETVDTELPIEVDLGLDQIFFLGDELVLMAQTNVPSGQIQDYSWSGTGGSAQCADCYQYQFVPLESGCETVLVTSIDGCQAWDEVCFTLRPGRHIYVPNVFHPNDSGDNDFFTIFSDASVKQILYLKIFSRWGEQLFQTNNIQTNHEPSGWDGNFRGNPMNPGVFVWVAEVEFIDGQVLFLKGDVTLVR